MPVLVKFSKDWADEFEAKGFAVYPSEKSWLRDADTLPGLSYEFGTNEGWEEGEIDEIDFTVEEITQEQSSTLIGLFGDSWGIWPL